jgi:hypothetical protein
MILAADLRGMKYKTLAGIALALSGCHATPAETNSTWIPQTPLFGQYEPDLTDFLPDLDFASEKVEPSFAEPIVLSLPRTKSSYATAHENHITRYLTSRPEREVLELNASYRQD